MGQWVVTTGSTALVAATAKTAIEIATGATVNNKFIGMDISFNGVSSSAVPVTWEICSYSASGTGTAITFAVAHRFSVETDTNPASTAKVNMTVEGTGTTVRWGGFVHPQTGFFYQWPLGREADMDNSQFMGIRLTAPAIVNYIVNLYFEE